LSYFSDDLFKSIVLSHLERINENIGVAAPRSDDSREDDTIIDIDEHENAQADDTTDKRDGNWAFIHRAPTFYGSADKYNSGWHRMREFFWDLADYETDSTPLTQSSFWSTLPRLLREDRVVLCDGKYQFNKLKLWNR